MKLTIFTPTYNRAFILGQLYQSLIRQTCHDFEWLIVDDGSADDTEALVRGWLEAKNPFPIRYHRQENGGKHRAINKGLGLAEGALFFTVDSDDYLTDDAVEKVLAWEAALPADGNYCGFAGNLGTAPDTTPNRIFDGPHFDGTALDRYGIIDGERAMVFYTRIHRQYPYPEFSGEKFMTEAVAWNRMAHDGYKMRFFNDIIWVYEYQEDGLTKAGNSLFMRNPRGYGLFLREKTEFLGQSRLKLWYTITCDMSATYSAGEIAAFLGAPDPLIRGILMLRKLLGHLRR